jgi:hypothetical protein
MTIFKAMGMLCDTDFTRLALENEVRLSTSHGGSADAVLSRWACGSSAPASVRQQIQLVGNYGGLTDEIAANIARDYWNPGRRG